MYSGTSNKGPSEKGTTSLQMTLPISTKSAYAIHLKRKTSLQGTKWMVPTVIYSVVPLYKYNCIACIPNAHIRRKVFSGKNINAHCYDLTFYYFFYYGLLYNAHVVMYKYMYAYLYTVFVLIIHSIHTGLHSTDHHFVGYR